VHRAILAKTGWGKSWYGQQVMAANAPEYPVFVVLDYKDEFRGLVEAGLADWFILGPTEADWSADRWRRFLAENPKVVLPRYRLEDEEWREAVAAPVRAARDLGQQAGGAFLAIDEAHIPAPQSGTLPGAIKGVATTGRGEQVSSLWMTQRAAELEETVLSQSDERVLGGFTSDADLGKVSSYTNVDEALNNPTASRVPSLPDHLCVDGEALPLRRFEEHGSTVGSEWLYNNDAGDSRRIDTRHDVEELTTHYGPEGRKIHDP
jgi:hypothetical protein